MRIWLLGSRRSNGALCFQVKPPALGASAAGASAAAGAAAGAAGAALGGGAAGALGALAGGGSLCLLQASASTARARKRIRMARHVAGREASEQVSAAATQSRTRASRIIQRCSGTSTH